MLNLICIKPKLYIYLFVINKDNIYYLNTKHRKFVIKDTCTWLMVQFLFEKSREMV